MYFDNLSDLMLMDGHGGFVWAAYAIALTVLVLLVALPLKRKSRFLHLLKQRIRRQSIQQGGSTGQASTPVTEG
jgi:heme exporter protein D